MVDYKAGRCAVYLFHIAALEVIDFHLVLIPPLGIVGGESGSLFKAAVRKFLPVRFDDHMGARHALRVEPPVGARGHFKGELFILIVVFADIDIKAVARAEMERVRLNFLRAFYLGRKRAFLILEVSEFLQKFGVVAIQGRELQGSQNGGEVCLFLHGFFELLTDRELGAL